MRRTPYPCWVARTIVDPEQNPLAGGLIDADRRRNGWGDEQERWAEHLGDVFGRGSFWSSSKAEKQKLYRKVAEEIVEFLAEPRGVGSDAAWWSAVLAARFGGLDFWRLSPPWKERHYEGVVHEIYLAKRLLADPELSDLGQAEAPGAGAASPVPGGSSGLEI